MDANPAYADGPLNVARALIQEGETDAAKEYVAKALAMDPKLARTHFFKALAEKADGNYDQALETLRYVESQYPQDRVVLNQIGRLLFLKRDYRQAVGYLQRVIQVDPEDIQANYTLLLALRGLGESERAARAEAAFKRFKADESAQTITAKRRMTSPEENNERQMIHDHSSILLGEMEPSTGSVASPRGVSRQAGGSQ